MPTLSLEALADLAAGGTDPQPPNPTAVVVATMRDLADLLEAFGDVGADERVSPYIFTDGRVALAGEPFARAFRRAGGTVGAWYRRPDGRWQRNVTAPGRPWEAIEESSARGTACGYCCGTGLEPEPEPMAGDGAETCAACGGVE